MKFRISFFDQILSMSGTHSSSRRGILQYSLKVLIEWAELNCTNLIRRTVHNINISIN
jgi:hypothetical protein